MTSPSVIKYFGEEMAQKRIAAIPDCKHVMQDGHHHFHMEQAQQAGHHITWFLNQPEPSQAYHVDS